MRRLLAAQLRTVFRSLRHRNYRLFFIGQGISLVGTWMQSVARGWLVYRLTRSPFLLGLVSFSDQLPVSLLTPLTGAVADRYNRHRIIVTTQSLAAVQAFVLAGLTLSGRVRVEHILCLSVISGVISAFDLPARRSFTVDMVENREDLSNAIALNSSLFNSARLVGPTVAGILVASVGEGFCFLINAASYLAVIAGLVAMRPPARPIREEGSLLLHIRQGIRYAAGHPTVRSILVYTAVFSLIGMPYSVVMPVIARETLRGGPRTYGFLLGAAGMGALSGALYLASRKSSRGLISHIPLAGLSFSLALIGVSFSRFPWLSMGLMVALGFSLTVQRASGNTVLQVIVDDDKQGRVLSLDTMAYVGTGTFGTLLAGSLAEKIGAPRTLLACGLCCLVTTSFFAFRLPRLLRGQTEGRIRKPVLP